jgi:hypothetical protein
MRGDRADQNERRRRTQYSASATIEKRSSNMLGSLLILRSDSERTSAAL